MESTTLSSETSPNFHIIRTPLWSTRDQAPLFRGNALPGQLAVFFACFGLPRRRAEHHAVAIKADLAHLVRADAGRVRRRIDPGDKPRAVEGVVAAIRAVGAGCSGWQLWPAVADHRHHPPLRVEHDPPHAPATIRSGQLLAVPVARRGGDHFPGADDRLHG